MTEKERCNKIMTMQRPPRIKIDNLICDFWSSTLKSYTIDECCICVTETHLPETPE